MGLPWHIYCGLALIAVYVHHIEGSPTKGNIKLGVREINGMAFESEAIQNEGMEETINGLFDKLDKLDVQALYQSEVTLERLANETKEKDLSKAGTSSNLPKYVITRQEKIYFFTNPTKNSSVNLKRNNDEEQVQANKITSDPEDDELQSYLKMAKKHTNNGPGWGSVSNINMPNYGTKRQQPLTSAQDEQLSMALNTMLQQYEKEDKFDAMLERLRLYLNKGK